MRVIVRRLASALMAMAVVLPGHASAQHSVREPVRVILDSDMNVDIDDMLALSTLHALQSRGEAKIVAITCSFDDKWGPSYIDLVDTYYGRPGIPVGIVRKGYKSKDPPLPNGVPLYTEYLSRLRTKNGRLVFPHKLVDGDKAPEAVRLLRNALVRQPDASVVMIEIGFSTNFARLLDSKPDDVSPLTGMELIKKKVRLLSMMAGNFGDATFYGRHVPKGSPETNIMLDMPAARRVLTAWPTPIVVSGFEIGSSMLFPGRAIRAHMDESANPIAMTYVYMDRAYRSLIPKDMSWPWGPGVLHDHSLFDPSAILYAIRPTDDYFSLSAKGKVVVLDGGGTAFQTSAVGNTQYLLVTDFQRARAVEALEMLVTEPRSLR